VRSRVFELIASWRWKRLRPDRPGIAHSLAGELIISLTSYPPRFPTLALTLACLCDQTVRADRIILWVADKDADSLPDEVSSGMRQAGVEIRTCEDLGSYKKLIPALEAFPNAYIVTADDDVYYPKHWLHSLLADFDGSSITCLTGFPIVHGRPDWLGRAPNGKGAVQCGCSGVLYPPKSLREEVTNRRFLSECPTGDDIWFYKMAREPVRTVGGRFTAISWLGSQKVALAHDNCAGLNDAMFAKLATPPRPN
jgi:hypothetical protein